MKGLLLCVFALLVTSGCTREGYADTAFPPVSGSPERGEQLVRSFGCGSCHTIPGIRDARGLVGPPLFFFSRRTYIAGQLPNTPDNLVRWIQDPQAIEPGTAMPTLGASEQQARDMAAYLYTLR